jgi:spore coat protein U-like protein
MKRKLIVVALFGLVALLPAGAFAQGSASTTLSVTASVASLCTISTSAVAFGSYDSLGANATSPLDANGGVTVTCTKGSVPVIGLGLGSHASGSTRQMATAGTDLLAYELYRANDYTSVWGVYGGANQLTAPAAPSKAPRTFTVYGRVAAGLDPAVGSYSDSVQATVNF